MTDIAIKTRDAIDVEVHLPGSKSYSNRALLIAALAKGTSTLSGLLESDDTKVMKNALQHMGLEFSINDEELKIYGCEGTLKEPGEDLFLNNAGTATRFLTTTCALINGTTIVTGNERMQERPIVDLLDGLKQLGVDCQSKTGCPPIKLIGPSLVGGLTKISGKISSQFISSILISAPYAQKPVIIEIKDELVSKPYIDITLDIMKTFGINVINKDYMEFHIPLGCYQACNYNVEPDASGASYFLNAAALTKGKAKVYINSDTVQGDFQYFKALERMGCHVKVSNSFIELEGSALKGIDIDMESIPDMAQSLAVVAAYAEGTTRITNVYNLRVKETDRLDACYNELKKMGIDVEQTRDSLTIHGGTPHGAHIDTYDDHRMAMAFSGAGLVTEGIVIKDAGCVSKTFPTFWDLFGELS
ncbi:MAG: 3-phosphoshikimate 1-carboxyvinyltransferase [Planctomycetota bacterium]|nr:MAG: 3-phosphoshikimate 1-carboxyvinyltransferase [Planctomycetota bacterium]